MPTEMWPHGTLNPAYDSCIPPRPSSKHKSRKVVHDSQVLPPHHVWRSEAARAARELAVRIQNDAKNAARPASATAVQKERFRRLADKANRRRPPFAATGGPQPNAHARHIYSIPADRLYSVSPLRKQTNSQSAGKLRVWRQGKWTTDLVAKQKVASRKRMVARKVTVHSDSAEAARSAAAEAEASRLAAEEAEADRLAAEEAVLGHMAAEEAEAGHLAAEEAEAGHLAAEEAEAGRLAAEEAEAGRLAAGEAEASRLAADEAEAGRLAAEEAEASRLAAEEAEASRLAAEEAEAGRLAAEEEIVGHLG